MTLVTEHLEQRGVRFEVLPHQRTYTTIDEARILGIDADEVLKTVVLDGRDGHVFAIIPAHHRLDMRLVRQALDDPHAKLADEDEIRHDYPEFELGSIPPIGRLTHTPMLVDPEVLAHDLVVFAGGVQRESIRTRLQYLLSGVTVKFAPIVHEVVAIG